MTTDLFLQLLRRTRMEFGYQYCFEPAVSITPKGVYEVRAALFGKPPDQHARVLTAPACVWHCFCVPDGETALAPGQDWRRELGITHEQEQALYFAGAELAGYDRRLRRRILRALWMFEWPPHWRPIPVCEGPKFQRLDTSRSRNPNGKFLR